MTLIEKFLTNDIDLECMSIAYHDKKAGEWHYDETPVGSVIIADTGVDGCHYCIVPRQGVSIDESPVYAVSPMDSEDTVVWVAKDFTDFISIGAALGSFTYISCCHSCDKKEFLQFVEESWSEGDGEKKKEAINLLRKQFLLKNYDDVFKHIIESYQDKNNHTELSFESIDIKAVKLGHYNKGF